MSEKKITLPIEGMTCAACSSRIEKVLNKNEGIQANVNLSTEKATVSYSDQYDINSIAEKIDKLGYQVPVEKVNLNIEGMTCAACSSRIEKVLNKMDGVQSASVNLSTEKGTVQYYKDVLSVDDITSRIENLGYHAESENNEVKKNKSDQLKRRRHQLIVSALLSLPLLVTMLTHLFGIHLPHIFMNPFFQLVFAAPVQFIIGWQFYRGAYKNIRNGGLNMDVLVALGTSASFFYSLYETYKWVINHNYEPHLYFETSAVLITLILLGKYLEMRAKHQTTHALTSLVKLQAKEARIKSGDSFVMVPLAEIKQGDILQVKPGEKIPMDGIIIEGKTSVDESMLTGESIPVEKAEQSEVIGSTLNKNGAFLMKVTHNQSDSVLQNIINTVEQAQTSKAPIQRLADVIAGYFVPIVVVIALLTFAVWMLWIDPGNFEHALICAIAVLVIACPCALGLATPTSIMTGTGRAAEAGILFKGGEHLERAHEVNAVVFDKTGTLTHGKPVVTDYIGNTEMLSRIAGVESMSEHPLADAICAYTSRENVSIESPLNFEAVSGQGVIAEFNEGQLLIGNRKLMANHHIDADQFDEQMTSFESEGKTAMLVADLNEVKGIIAVMDTLKENAEYTIRQLKEQNIEVYLLTGDNDRTAQAIAKKVGIQNVMSEVMPQDKLEMIKQLQNSGKKVAMVGDGINDAPALVEADIGIAIGTGTDAAIEASDITILRGELSLVPQALKMSRLTMRNIKQNLFWAFAYNVIGIPIAAAGFLAPWLAGAAMAFSSVSVVTNALRLKRMKL